MIEADSGAVWVLRVVVGEEFPAVNEDRLFGLGGLLGVVGDEVVGSAKVLDGVLDGLAGGVAGASWGGLVGALSEYGGDDGFLVLAGRVMHRLGLAYAGLAVQVQYVKLMTVLGAVEVLAEIAVDAILAMWNPFAALQRMLTEFLIFRLLFSSWLFRLALRVAVSMGVQMLVQVLMDVFVQVVQLRSGSRKQWDRSLTLSAVGVGALGGALGLGVGALGGGIAHLVGKAVGKGAGHSAGKDLGKDVGRDVGKDAPAGGVDGGHVGRWWVGMGEEMAHEGLTEYLTSIFYGGFSGQGWSQGGWGDASSGVLSAAGSFGGRRAGLRLREWRLGRAGGLPPAYVEGEGPPVYTERPSGSEAVLAGGAPDPGPVPDVVGPGPVAAPGNALPTGGGTVEVSVPSDDDVPVPTADGGAVPVDPGGRSAADPGAAPPSTTIAGSGTGVGRPNTPDVGAPRPADPPVWVREALPSGMPPTGSAQAWPVQPAPVHGTSGQPFAAERLPSTSDTPRPAAPQAPRPTGPTVVGRATVGPASTGRTPPGAAPVGGGSASVSIARATASTGRVSPGPVPVESAPASVGSGHTPVPAPVEGAGSVAARRVSSDPIMVEDTPAAATYGQSPAVPNSATPTTNTKAVPGHTPLRPAMVDVPAVAHTEVTTPPQHQVLPGGVYLPGPTDPADLLASVANVPSFEDWFVLAAHFDPATGAFAHADGTLRVTDLAEVLPTLPGWDERFAQEPPRLLVLGCDAADPAVEGHFEHLRRLLDAWAGVPGTSVIVVGAGPVEVHPDHGVRARAWTSLSATGAVVHPVAEVTGVLTGFTNDVPLIKVTPPDAGGQPVAFPARRPTLTVVVPPQQPGVRVATQQFDVSPWPGQFPEQWDHDVQPLLMRAAGAAALRARFGLPLPRVEWSLRHDIGAPESRAAVESLVVEHLKNRFRELTATYYRELSTIRVMPPRGAREVVDSVRFEQHAGLAPTWPEGVTPEVTLMVRATDIAVPERRHDLMTLREQGWVNLVDRRQADVTAYLDAIGDLTYERVRVRDGAGHQVVAYDHARLDGDPVGSRVPIDVLRLTLHIAPGADSGFTASALKTRVDNVVRHFNADGYLLNGETRLHLKVDFTADPSAASHRVDVNDGTVTGDRTMWPAAMIGAGGSFGAVVSRLLALIGVPAPTRLSTQALETERVPPVMLGQLWLLTRTYSPSVPTVRHEVSFAPRQTGELTVPYADVDRYLRDTTDESRRQAAATGHRVPWPDLAMLAQTLGGEALARIALGLPLAGGTIDIPRHASLDTFGAAVADLILTNAMDEAWQLARTSGYQLTDDGWRVLGDFLAPTFTVRSHHDDSTDVRVRHHAVTDRSVNFLGEHLDDVSDEVALEPNWWRVTHPLVAPRPAGDRRVRVVSDPSATRPLRYGTAEYRSGDVDEHASGLPIGRGRRFALALEFVPGPGVTPEAATEFERFVSAAVDTVNGRYALPDGVEFHLGIDNGSLRQGHLTRIELGTGSNPAGGVWWPVAERNPESLVPRLLALLGATIEGPLRMHAGVPVVPPIAFAHIYLELQARLPSAPVIGLLPDPLTGEATVPRGRPPAGALDAWMSLVEGSSTATDNAPPTVGPDESDGEPPPPASGWSWPGPPAGDLPGKAVFRTLRNGVVFVNPPASVNGRSYSAAALAAAAGELRVPDNTVVVVGVIGVGGVDGPGFAAVDDRESVRLMSASTILNHVLEAVDREALRSTLVVLHAVDPHGAASAIGRDMWDLIEQRWEADENEPLPHRVLTSRRHADGRMIWSTVGSVITRPTLSGALDHAWGLERPARLDLTAGVAESLDGRYVSQYHEPLVVNSLWNRAHYVSRQPSGPGGAPVSPFHRQVAVPVRQGATYVEQRLAARAYLRPNAIRRAVPAGEGLSHVVVSLGRGLEAATVDLPASGTTDGLTATVVTTRFNGELDQRRERLIWVNRFVTEGRHPWFVAVLLGPDVPATFLDRDLPIAATDLVTVEPGELTPDGVISAVDGQEISAPAYAERLPRPDGPGRRLVVLTQRFGSEEHLQNHRFVQELARHAAILAPIGGADISWRRLPLALVDRTGDEGAGPVGEDGADPADSDDHGAFEPMEQVAMTEAERIAYATEVPAPESTRMPEWSAGQVVAGAADRPDHPAVLTLRQLMDRSPGNQVPLVPVGIPSTSSPRQWLDDSAAAGLAVSLAPAGSRTGAVSVVLVPSRFARSVWLGRSGPVATVVDVAAMRRERVTATLASSDEASQFLTAISSVGGPPTYWSAGPPTGSPGWGLASPGSDDSTDSADWTESDSEDYTASSPGERFHSSPIARGATGHFGRSPRGSGENSPTVD